MTNVEAIRDEVLRKFAHVADLGNGVLRGERRLNGKIYATSYIDLSDDVVGRSRNLAKFQEELLGEAFFEGDGNQRWNSYLYFWAGPRSREDAGFGAARSLIERDRHFARKYVLNEEELLSRIDGISQGRPKTVVSDDVLERWSEQLRQASLESILEQKPRAQFLRQIESGAAFAQASSAVPRASSGSIDPLGVGMLRRLQVGNYRAGICSGQLTFGNVNLIVGQNGSGKTSLLELIEALYCGRIRRDPTGTFDGIQATLHMPDGSAKDVTNTTVASAIKARNLAWYGRSDHHASSISEGFTRFNFLDTDAAFRLSSETSVERIKEDLSRLLVGPDTSTLWAYLTKLHDDVAASLRSLDERIPSIMKQTELLGAEIKRLREAPSLATSLAKTYRANLLALGAKWDVGDQAVSVEMSDRARLESLARGFRHAKAIPSLEPKTVAVLRDRIGGLDRAIEGVAILRQKYEVLRGEIASSQSRVDSFRQNINVLQQWKNYCEAGAPELMISIERVANQVGSIRSSIGGLTFGAIPEFSPEYRNETVSAAMAAAEESLSRAQAQERVSIESLSRVEQIGQSLKALKGELRAIASAIVERSGDSNHCPVCGTFHDHDDLLQKIESLESAGNPAANDGLRLAIQESRARAAREQKAIAAINALARYSISSGAPGTATIADLRLRLEVEHNRLDALLVEQSQLSEARESLGRRGLDLSSYNDIRGAASSVLGKESIACNADELKSEIEEFERKLKNEQHASVSFNNSLSEIVNSANAFASEAGVVVQKSSSLDDLVLVLDRARQHFRESMEFIQDASRQISVPDLQPFDYTLSSIEEVIESFDRAKHAEESENGMRNEISKKSEELQSSTELLNGVIYRRDNLIKAEEALRRIRLEYSLEDATRGALESIREQVSYIFERIHSPSEYVLGSFDGDSVLVTREGGRPRGVNQVSTGQRAALALSIFLALNQSAANAPKIMLIDDPVAHVDDLNALSFFDYLRDLVVSERKQIFFATADARVAALFQKKFEFLGEERYRRIVLSR